MAEIKTCTPQIKGLIDKIKELDKGGVTYTDDWLNNYINKWFMV